MKCECCKKSTSDSNLFYDGEWSYCYDCVKTKKIDNLIHESELVEWDYCEHCKKIIPLHLSIGSCNILMACKQRLKNGYTHLCFDCGKKHDHGNDTYITSCILCTHYLRKIRND